jgi:tetratricopeptide (TPR) repeat protein
VDDHADPIGEIGRLLALAMINDDWNRGWTAFTEKRFPEALRWQERASKLAERQLTMLPEVLYDLAVIRLANGDKEGAAKALARALELNPKLEAQAAGDKDLEGLQPIPKR